MRHLVQLQIITTKNPSTCLLYLYYMGDVSSASKSFTSGTPFCQCLLEASSSVPKIESRPSSMTLKSFISTLSKSMELSKFLTLFENIFLINWVPPPTFEQSLQLFASNSFKSFTTLFVPICFLILWTHQSSPTVRNCQISCHPHIQTSQLCRRCHHPTVHNWHHYVIHVHNVMLTYHHWIDTK